MRRGDISIALSQGRAFQSIKRGRKSLGRSTSSYGVNTYRLASPEAGTGPVLSSGASQLRALSVCSSGMWEKVASALHGGS